MLRALLTAEETQRLHSELEKSENPQLKYIVAAVAPFGLSEAGTA